MKNKILDESGVSLQDVVPIAITLVVIAITLSIGADVLTSVQEGQTANTYSYNATQNGLQGIDELSSFQDTWAVILALAVIIGVLGFLATR